MQPDPAPKPPTTSRGIWLPLLFSGGLLLLLAGLSYTSHFNRRDLLVVLVLEVAALVVVNVVALLVAALARKGQWAAGFALSIGLLLLVGLGTCGLMTAT